jgi:hypothetical protein
MYFSTTVYNRTTRAFGILVAMLFDAVVMQLFAGNPVDTLVRGYPKVLTIDIYKTTVSHFLPMAITPEEANQNDSFR